MIPIADPQLDDAELERVRSVVESGMIADGPEVRSFEDEFASFCGTEHAVATSNGTTALHTALEALGLGEGDTVLTTPFSFIASANAIRLAGANPIFADIDPETYLLDPEAVRNAIENHGDVDAIVVVHLYGLAADMSEFQSIADEYDLLLIEDAAQAHGAEYGGSRVGSFGDVACFSFYPTKNMTTAEGGMITTDRSDVRDKAKRFINHGRSDNYEHIEIGHNFRMTSIAAAIGRSQLEKLPRFTKSRRQNAANLSDGLCTTPVDTPTEPEDRKHVYHQYTVRTRHRDALADHLDNRNIGSGIYYPTCIHEQPAYSHVSAQFPTAERAAETVLSLPVHPAVSDSDIETITTAVEEFYSDD
ncbi:DegT/DnrJ/EryC1/StrS family aminotransferase [Halopenitus sp. POP-27]|uniref:DegT/DnrJ/EryC1/StrS family aminotransferase n=1 Tax=Halopenitus sp. POP-27 TaxID=2994425 RepID=UPI0024697086|nr:DegT/DnrJ/EryC1/StrS family aminotransferase [Halopenitus sp. POP-27]